MSESEDNNGVRYPEVNMRDVLRERFSTGQGFVQLSSGMTDKEMLVVIKLAISFSNGKAFTVIPQLKMPAIAVETRAPAQ
jgi:hypothetical protein